VSKEVIIIGIEILLVLLVTHKYNISYLPGFSLFHIISKANTNKKGRLINNKFIVKSINIIIYYLCDKVNAPIDQLTVEACLSGHRQSWRKKI